MEINDDCLSIDLEVLANQNSKDYTFIMHTTPKSLLTSKTGVEWMHKPLINLITKGHSKLNKTNL